MTSRDRPGISFIGFGHDLLLIDLVHSAFRKINAKSLIIEIVGVFRDRRRGRITDAQNSSYFLVQKVT